MSSAMLSLCRFHSIRIIFSYSVLLQNFTVILSSYFIQWQAFRSSHPNFWSIPETFVLTSSLESYLSRPIFTKNFLLEYWVLTLHLLFDSTNCLDNKGVGIFCSIWLQYLKFLIEGIEFFKHFVITRIHVVLRTDG